MSRATAGFALSERHIASERGGNAATVTHVAWKQKPSYGIVATEDRTISPDLERFMYKRAGSKITEISSSHMVLMSHPQQVAKVILEAVDAVE